MLEFWIILSTMTLSPLQARLGECANQQAVFASKSEAVEAYKNWPSKASVRIFKAVEVQPDFVVAPSTNSMTAEKFEALLNAVGRISEIENFQRCESIWKHNQSRCALYKNHEGPHRKHGPLEGPQDGGYNPDHICIATWE